MRILVAYASCHGSTEEIAVRIAEGLESAGDTTLCRPAKVLAGVTGYDAAVVGSAIHDQAWLPDAVDFLTRHAAVLSGMRVWLFSVGMPAALPLRLRKWAMQEEDQVTAKLPPQVRPRGHHLFSGVIRKEHLTPAGRLRFRTMGGRYGDFRDWAEIESWTRIISDDLHESSRRLAPT